ncbi:EamA family transporter [Pendulispora rubella]|uniref:EamA family transporter n=1 Tax=Pendulispora rubella TaxID=2741070 RepID=A0ABZ2L575_9BACT
MSPFLPLATVIGCGVVYHVAQKASGAVSPWPVLTIAYGAAFAVALFMLGLGWWGRGDAVRWPAARDCVASLALGLAAFGIEAGFFFVYRSGWPLSSAQVITNLSVTAVLAVTGIMVFGEHLTGARAVGLALAAGGATLIARG